MRHLVIPCTARCLAIGLFSAFIALFATPGYAQTEVPSDWPLKPSGLSAGDEFRLMFMGKNPLAADSTDIAVYDAYVQGRIAAIGHAEIKAYSSHFKVLGSTATVNARAHTGTTGTGGVPIHWLNGGKVADDYGDFYDGAWDDKDGATLEDGTSLSSRRKDQFICTGTNDDGTTASGPMGESSCTGTKINISGSTLSGESLSSADNSRYLVLSGVFRVGDFATPAIPVIESVAVTSDPGSDGEYVKDDAIEVTVTFSEAVVVTGTPKIRLKLNNASSVDRASYVAADSTATELAFSYNVKAGDYSHDGISIPPNGILLSGGTIKNQAGTTDANLDHDRQTELSAHKVHVRPVVSSVTVASTPASGTSYATGETIWIDLTFNRKVSVFTDAGTPTLGVVIGTTTRQGVYTTTVGDDVVRFEYVVQAGDSDSDGIQIDNNAITWNGGFIIRQEHGDVADKAPLQVPASGGSTGRNPFADHRVNAVDVLGVDVDPTSLTVAEGGNDYYSVFLTAQPSGTVTVTPSVTGSSDVTVNPASLTFTTANWSVSQDVTVSAAQDADADTATIENTVSGANYGSVIADDVVVTVTITDDDTRGLAFSVTVVYATADGTALAGSDYTATSGTLTFAAGDTSKTIDVLVTDDSLGEGDEDFTVTLSSASNAGMSDGEATGTITDNEIPTLTIADATATEGASVSFTVTLDPESSSDVTVAYATSDGTATADSADADGADYTAPASGAELTISAGHTSGTITIATGDDTVYEEDETFTVTLSSASSNAALGTSKTATGTIENDDSPSADAALKVLTMTAGGSGVTLSPTFVAESYSYRADVANTVSSVSVAAEANHRKATVAIIGGTDLAFAENIVTVRVTAEDGATTQDYTVIVTRALPELAWEGQSTLPLDEDTGAVELTVTLTPASSDQVTVDYVTMAAGAMAGEDYTHASGTLTFAPGETRKTTTVTILDDTLYEPGSVDVVLVVLSNATGTAVLGAATIYLQIQDNESPPTATMEDVTVDEGDGTMVFTLSLAHGISRGIEYRTDYGGLGGTATEWVDYDPIFSESGVVNLRIPARQTSATFAVTILDDDVHEADETISIRWSRISPDVATESIDVTGTITNDDERGVEVSATTLTVREDGDGTYTVVLTSQPTGPVTVTPLHGSGDTDVTVSGALTFTTADWNVAQTVTVSAASDTDAENDTATIEHTIAGADYDANSVTADDVTVTVTDDDTASTQVTLAVDPTAVGEGDGATTVTVTGRLDHAVRTEDTEVTVTVSAGTASASDFAPVSAFTLTIDANQPFGTAMFTLTPTDDDVDEVDETVTVEGGAAAAGLNVTATTVTINNDDERGVQVSASLLTVPEGGDDTYTVVLTSQPTGPVTVTPLHGSGDTDVTVSGALMFTTADWNEAQTVTVSAGSDADAENDTATIGHTIAGADYGANSVTADDVAVMVTDVDTASTQVTLAVDPTAVGEGDGATTVTVTGTLNNAVRTVGTAVTVTVSAGTASRSDFAPVSAFTLTIDANQPFGTAMFTLTPTDDDVDEVDETVTVEGGAAAAGLNVTATTVTINDDDERGVQVSPTTLTVPEGADGTYTVVLTSEPIGDVTVTPSHGSGDTDVTVSPSPLTFTAANWDEAQTVNGIPLELFEPDPRAELRSAEHRAITPAPGTVGINLDPIRPAVFAGSIAARLGIDMPRVASGTYASATITTSQTAEALRKAPHADAAAAATAGALTVTTATPKRISARLELALEDIAAVGQENFESILRQNLSLVLSDQLDDQMINGDGNAPNLKGMFANLTNPAAPAAAVETFDRMIAIFAGGVDGLWATMANQIGIVVNPETYQHALQTFRDRVIDTGNRGGVSLGDDSFADYASAKFGGFWTNKRMPDKVTHIAQAILYRSGRSAEGASMGMRTAVCPHWGEVSIDDIYSGSASGVRSFTMHVLLGDVILVQADAYAQVAFRVSV